MWFERTPSKLCQKLTVQNKKNRQSFRGKIPFRHHFNSTDQNLTWAMLASKPSPKGSSLEIFPEKYFIYLICFTCFIKRFTRRIWKWHKFKFKEVDLWHNNFKPLMQGGVATEVHSFMKHLFYIFSPLPFVFPPMRYKLNAAKHSKFSKAFQKSIRGIFV